MMHNLLAQPLPASEIEPLLGPATETAPLPPLGAPRWIELARNPVVSAWLEQIRQKADAEADEPLPELTAELYAEYHRNGYRLGFERRYFARRQRLANAAVALLFARAVADDRAASRYSDSFLKKLAGVFGETSWALPAHVRDNPSGQDPRMIDLFAAETANLMAEILHVFREILPPQMQEAIRARLRRDIFDNYLEPADRFVWLRKTNNWNAVCHQGVIGAALTAEDDSALVARLLEKASRFLPFFLKGFTPDGGCSEGPAYWEYGFGWFAILNQQLEARSAGGLSLVEGDPLIRAVARYGPQVLLKNDYQVNFADCPPRKVVRPSLFQYLGERFDDPMLLEQARRNYRRLRETGLALEGNRADLFNFLRLFLFCPDDLPSGDDGEKEDVYFPDLEVLIARGRSRIGAFLEFAAKGGHNGEHHNHNDCGSFLLHVEGEPVFLEIGSPEYNRDFFGPKRYQNLAARTRGHSLPIVNGFEQGPGEEFRSRVILAESGGEVIRFSVDLTRCYPAESGCRLCRRELVFRKDEGLIEISDRFDLDRIESVETALITRAEVEAEGADVLLRISDGRTVRLSPGADTVFDRVESCPFSNHRGEPDEVKRIVFVPAPNAGKSFALSFRARVEAD